MWCPRVNGWYLKVQLCVEKVNYNVELKELRPRSARDGDQKEADAVDVGRGARTMVGLMFVLLLVIADVEACLQCDAPPCAVVIECALRREDPGHAEQNMSPGRSSVDHGKAAHIL